MKGLIAFVAHCPEVRENQRVVVVGECAELGGWDLGGALSLTPAPCVHPWWVSSEVEVNLSECTMGVSGDFESEVETDRKVGRVGVSKLNFRLVAVPNSSNEVEVSDPDNPVCLEPLNGGDFRAVCLVDGLPPVDRCSVGERGHNTIHVGAEEGGEELLQQKREMVGISVEWGVPESVQLGLIPLHPNGQTDHPQKETVNERGGLSCPQSESACAVSSEERTQRDSEEMLARTDEGQHASSLSMHPPQSAAEFEGQYPDSRIEMEGDGGNNSRSEPERQKTTRVEGGEEDVCAGRSDSVGGSNAPADTESDSMLPRSRPLPPTRHLSHDCTLDRQREEWQRTQGVTLPLKRRRSEASFSDAEAEADECDALSGFPVAGEGVALQGKEGCVMREEKQRRVTVSVSDSARLFSESCVGRGGPIGGSNSQGGDGGGEVKRNRHGQILCVHGRVRYRCKECGGGSVCEHGRQRHGCKECGESGICEHGRQRHRCKECGGKGVCQHGRQRSQCKECGGKGICEHGRIRSQCKECGGKSICEHGRQRSKCKECGGGSICEHGRRRCLCKECGGKNICQHGRIRYRCKECGGKSICEHGRQRFQCKACGGKGICEHGRERHRCKECGGKSICEHGRIRSQCKECGGKSICQHGRQRSQCKECGGNSICEHGRRRCECKDCGGKSICQHGRIRYRCKECGSSLCQHGRERSKCKDCGGQGICRHDSQHSQCKECKQVSSLPSPF